MYRFHFISTPPLIPASPLVLPLFCALPPLGRLPVSRINASPRDIASILLLLVPLHSARPAPSPSSQRRPRPRIALSHTDVAESFLKLRISVERDESNDIFFASSATVLRSSLALDRNRPRCEFHYFARWNSGGYRKSKMRNATVWNMPFFEYRWSQISSFLYRTANRRSWPNDNVQKLYPIVMFNSEGKA